MLPAAPPFAEAENVTKVRQVVARLATSTLPILIAGEVGTGRRTLATAVAQSRARGELPLVVTTGFEGLPSKLRERHGSSLLLLLHHIHALDAHSQVELATRAREPGLLLIATGNIGSELARELAVSLDSTHVTLPALRERDNDAIQWAEVFIERAAADLGCSVPKLSVEARRAIAAHPWPGNLTELESVIRRAVLLRPAELIEPDDLGFVEKLVVQPLNDAVDEFRMKYVTKVLAHFDGNRTQAARALGINPRTIFRYLATTKEDGT